MLGAVNASVLHTDRRHSWAASGIDGACAPRRFGSYAMAKEWLTLTPHFDQAYPAVISLVSFRHPLHIARCGAVRIGVHRTPVSTSP